MPIELTQRHGGRILEVAASGKLTDRDYQTFVPAFDRLAQAHRKVRVLFEMTQFHGWDAQGAWDDFKFGVRHYDHFDRLAVVGELPWQQWLAKLSKPFTTAQVRYFDRSDLEKARAWLAEDVLKADVASGG